MNTIAVSESALDSIKRMGEADAARISELENALKRIATWVNCDHMSPHTRSKAMLDISNSAMAALRVSPNAQPIAKGEN